MIIKLLRHAQTEGNIAGQYVGSSDLPLSTAGIEYAAAITEHAGAQLVYTSALQRTIQTARLLCPEAKIIPCSGLNEMDFGSFEGRTPQELERDEAYLEWVESLCELPCPGGERKAEFTVRCVRAFQSVLAKSAAEGAEDLTFVVHGGTIMAVLSELARPGRPYFDWKADFCGGYLLKHAGGARPLELLGEIVPGAGAL